MEYNFSEQQEMLRRMVRDFSKKEVPKSLVRQMEKDSSGFSPELWTKMADLGWMSLLFPEECGGMAGTYMDMVVLFEEMGRACLPGPFFTSIILGGLAISYSTDEAKKAEYLPTIGQGKHIFTLALTEVAGTYNPQGIKLKAEKSANDYILNGIKLFVPYADIADKVVVVAREGNAIDLFVLNPKTDGITIVPLQTITGDKFYEMTFNNVKIPATALLGKSGEGWPVIEKVIIAAKIALCAEMVGMSSCALEMAVEYAKTRIQFDKPIGSFQIIQHYCANMATDVETSKYATYKAAWALDRGMPALEETVIAKGWTSSAARRVIATAHQIHGALGFAADHDLGLYYKRLKGAELMFGDDEVHKELMAELMGI